MNTTLLNTIKLNLTGGLLSPGKLADINQCLRSFGVENLYFGLRQQLLIPVSEASIQPLIACLQSKGIEAEVNTDEYPNIISSICTEGVFPAGQWLSEGVYQDVFDGFDYKPKLKVNISDNFQSFTPFFTGNLNFVASHIPNFWFLYVRLKQSNIIFRWSDLIFTNEIPKISQAIEKQIVTQKQTKPDKIELSIHKNLSYIHQSIEQDLAIQGFSLPYYEGFNRYGNKTWLGIYRREEAFSTAFIDEICQLCMETRVGQICVTPWKSLIIKNIEEKDRPRWDALLGKFGINVRHAANELNWQIEDLSPEGLAIKKAVIRDFDDKDVRTFGLSFAVQTRPKSEVFGSVIIKKSTESHSESSPYMDFYDVYHTEFFNPNSRRQLVFDKGISQNNLPVVLRKLTQKYYQWKHQETEIWAQSIIAEKPSEELLHDTRLVHQCPNCLSVYNEEYGDLPSGIEAGISFAELPQTYVCWLCETPKQRFIEKEMAIEIV